MIFFEKVGPVEPELLLDEEPTIMEDSSTMPPINSKDIEIIMSERLNHKAEKLESIIEQPISKIKNANIVLQKDKAKRKNIRNFTYLFQTFKFFLANVEENIEYFTEPALKKRKVILRFNIKIMSLTLIK